MSRSPWSWKSWSPTAWVRAGILPREVVREGLRLLEERGRLREEALIEVRQKIEAGIDSLDRGEAIDAEALFDELEERIDDREARSKELAPRGSASSPTRISTLPLCRFSCAAFLRLIGGLTHLSLLPFHTGKERSNLLGERLGCASAVRVFLSRTHKRSEF